MVHPFRQCRRARDWAARNVRAGCAVVVGALSGPVFHFSDTWQLVINTGTTIITFLMVFLIQNTQNRDSQAMHVKLDEVIRALEGAHNGLLDLEELGDEGLEKVRGQYRALARKARDDVEAGGHDMGCEDVQGVSEDVHGKVAASLRATVNRKATRRHGNMARAIDRVAASTKRGGT